MDNQDELMAIANMLKHSKVHGLEIECVWSLVHEIAGMARTTTSEDIVQACNNALNEWDL